MDSRVFRILATFREPYPVLEYETYLEGKTYLWENYRRY